MDQKEMVARRIVGRVLDVEGRMEHPPADDQQQLFTEADVDRIVRRVLDRIGDEEIRGCTLN